MVVSAVFRITAATCIADEGFFSSFLTKKKTKHTHTRTKHKFMYYTHTHSTSYSCLLIAYRAIKITKKNFHVFDFFFSFFVLLRFQANESCFQYFHNENRKIDTKIDELKEKIENWMDIVSSSTG